MSATGRDGETRANRDLARQIFSGSGMMIGVCTTLIGLVKVAEAHIGPSRVDEFGGCVALAFLTSAALSYLAIRHANRPRFANICERIADLFFLGGLMALTCVAVLFGYEVI